MKKRGRPSVDPGGKPERINTRVSQETFDALCRRARRGGKELADHVRDVLDRDAAAEILSSKNRQGSEVHPI